MIYVIDPGKPPVIEPQTGGGMCGDSFGQDRSGFPPRVTYGLFIDPKPGDTVLLSSPKPVYVRRASSPSGCDVKINRNDYRGEFIASAANVHPPVTTHYRYEIAWADDYSYTVSVDRLHKDLLADYQRMLDAVVKRSFLSREDAALRPEIVLRIEDQRSNKPHDPPPTPRWD